MTPSSITYRHLEWIFPLGAVLALAAFGPWSSPKAVDPGVRAQLLLGRSLVLNHDCNGCHGGADPAEKGWLAGVKRTDQEVLVGPRAFNTSAKTRVPTQPREMTPDNGTGIQRMSERDI